MTRKKILTVVGARPQFVKAAVVSRALAERSESQEVLLHTGQHFDDNMSTIFFDELGVPPPAYNLGIGGGGHAANTGRAMEAIERVINVESPDFVLVYGDTDSTLAGALAAAKLSVPIAHVEAGLRSFNRRMPEEINRVLTDHLSTILFAPSEAAVTNLGNEGIRGEQVRLVGDVMFDAVKLFGKIAEQRSNILDRLKLQNGDYILATLHRQENVDDPRRLSAIIDGLSRSQRPVVFPLHPRTRKRIAEFGLELSSPIQAIDPIGYLDMMLLERNARIIATDSGGVQKEAYFHGVPCLTLRDETEWVELVDIGVNRIVGADSTAIGEALCEQEFTFATRNIYGSGVSAEEIVSHMMYAMNND